MNTLGILALVGLLLICAWNIADILKKRPPNSFYGKGILSKFNWFLHLFRWGILPTLVFLLILVVLLSYVFE